MNHTILGLYLQSLLLAAIIVLVGEVVWLFKRALQGVDQTSLQRQQFLYDLLIIYVLTVPVFSFGIVSILMMLRV